MVVQNQSQLGEGSAIPTDPHHIPTFIQPSTQPQKTQQPRKPKRKDTQVPQPSDPIENVADEAVHKELGDSLVRAATTTSSIKAEHDSVLLKEKLKAARNRQKSYANNRRKPLEFEVGDRVLLNVSSWKGVICFGKNSKLAPSFLKVRQKNVVQYDGMEVGKLRFINIEYSELKFEWLSVCSQKLQISMGMEMLFTAQVEVKPTDTGCCLSSATAADCSRGRSRDPKATQQASFLDSVSEQCFTPVYDSDGSTEKLEMRERSSHEKENVTLQLHLSLTNRTEKNLFGLELAQSQSACQSNVRFKNHVLQRKRECCASVRFYLKKKRIFLFSLQ
ncbi:hypothetical protein Tco_1265036 [Tanacetum coccineum]